MQWTDRQTDTMKLIVTLCNFVNNENNYKVQYLRVIYDLILTMNTTSPLLWKCSKVIIITVIEGNHHITIIHIYIAI